MDTIINNQFILFFKFILKDVVQNLSVIFKIKIYFACIHDKQILFNNITIILLDIIIYLLSLWTNYID